MSIKVSRKQLKELAKNVDAFYCGGNVYTHENVTYYITHKELSKLTTYKLFTLLGNIKSMAKELGIKKVNKDFCIINDSLIAYSVGTYGNIGQLVKYEMSNNKGDSRVFYTYYC